ncbi:MAG: ABC transporter ATP-binding protein [Candidatus Cloacimonetes bacterium]|nr:energy-coupling factor ABC transporter ATP-binding protein [Candidatus Cloacimonadota bacterium]MDD2505736.1 ABC transporter ATP-binding protein [Candidatus Cloacimonadota bacterium]MDD4148107.1 ABC transporter ATP-binding protein [Candidatus Cloacimonadota bacterium]MDD4559158.1 ABC transporter ATP-binding protein [Candidatus Cloacimonadota bacterium]
MFPKLQMRELELQFPDAPATLFQGLNLDLDAGQILVISGGNSSGKSSLINCLCGIIPKGIPARVSGSIRWGDRSLKEIPLCEIYRFISLAPAETREQMLMPTVELELAFALENMGLPPSEIRKRIDSAADRFGIYHLLQAAPQNLSGGEQRLLLCAICDSMQNPVLLMDEPETGLSESSLALLCEWLMELRKLGKGIVLASHNPHIISMADSRIHLEKTSVHPA